MREFFSALWPDPGLRGNVTIWLNPGRDSLHVPLIKIVSMSDDDVAELVTLNQDKNVYFGLGLRCAGLPRDQQGGRQQIIAIPGFSADLDVAHPEIKGAHAAKKLPPTDDDALRLLEGGPAPTMLVSTGYGWHVYWLFRRPWILATAADRKQAGDAFKRFQEPLIARGAAKGWHVDSTATIQRVWRLPGMDNLKGGARAPVTWEYYDDATRYDPGEIVLGITSATSSAAPPPSAATPPPASPDPADLDRVRAEMRGAVDANQNKPGIDAVLAGKSFSEPGDRDASMQRICSAIVWLSKTARAMDPAQLAEVMSGSLGEWAAEPDAEKTLDEELAKAVEKFGRAQEDFRANEARKKPQLDALARALRRTTRGVDPDNLDDSEDEDKSEILQKHAIIQRQGTFHVFSFVEPARYSHPLTRDEVLVYARDAWDPAPVFDLTYINDKDVEKQKTMGRILQEYATNARIIVGDMTLDKSYYSRDESVFYHAVTPLRDLEPRYDANIAMWLSLLSDDHDKLLDWLAVLTLLDKACGALYLSGASGSGKNLLSSGSSRLWHTGAPTSLDKVIGGFNADIFRCPLIYVDEALPAGVKDISAKLRSLIGATDFTCSEKFLSNHSVNGSVRLLIGANNDSVLSMGREDMSKDDMQAVACRFIHLHAMKAAAEWLVEHNPGNCLTDHWVAGDLMARHLLWLRDNRVVVPGDRFVVEGKKSDIHRRLLMQGAYQDVFEWLVRFLDDPKKLTQVYKSKLEDPLACVGNGKLLVNTQAVIDCWSIYMQTPLPNRGHVRYVGEGLKKLADRTVARKIAGKVRSHHDIDFDHLFGWADEYQIGDLDKMKENLKQEDADSGAEESTESETEER